MAEIINLIEQDFEEKQREELAHSLANAQNRYQAAFHFLLGRRGPQAANEIIRRAVASARVDAVARGSGYVLDASTSEDACRGFEADPSGWTLTPSVAALGHLAVRYPKRFGKTILTTNFDPLIGVSISAAGGTSFRTVLHRDGNPSHTAGDGCHIVHLHGYWYGSDTLHTGRQLGQQRAQLKASLIHLLRDKTVVVIAYGGWDDVFTRTLVEVVLDDNAFPEIIWTFRDSVPRVRTNLLNLLKPGIDRGRVSLYSGVDCHIFLPSLLSTWESLENPTIPERSLSLRPDPVKPRMSTEGTNGRPAHTMRAAIEANEEDRPPILDFYVGRERDLYELQNRNYRVAFITGIGGQGKSALAASLFNSAVDELNFNYRLWRDCKEQSDKFEVHLIHLIEALNDGRVLAGELSKQPIDALADLFAALTRDIKLIVIFDNVDHYVDLETRALTAAAGTFVERFLSIESAAKLVFTCRPSIRHTNLDVFSTRLGGLDLGAAEELFELRRANVAAHSVARAHEVTGGHALWLDLLAAQVAARQNIELDDLLSNIATGGGEIPDATLRSIWQSLREREQVVLQALAETLRPTTTLQISHYLRSRANFNQTNRAVRALRGLNLLVLKVFDEGEEAFELHPVIRAFIYKTFQKAERVWYIDAILAVYSIFFGSHLTELLKRPVQATVRRWMEGAELCINAGHYEQALIRLNEVRGALRRHEAPGEFVRVAGNLFAALPVGKWRDCQHFDAVFHEYHRGLVNLGRFDSAGEALVRYEETLTGKDARYINYCDMQTYMHWMAGDYLTAIQWGTDGANLKSDSGVDSPFASDHHLALAQRDSGAIDPALAYFLGGVDIDLVLDPKIVDVDRGGAFYGNIGRCFQLMGQIDSALTCYAKSARLIEKEYGDGDLENQAYIRQWIGELFLVKGERAVALHFLVAAIEKWSIVSPPKAARVGKTIEAEFGEEPVPSGDVAEKFALRWIASGGQVSTSI